MCVFAILAVYRRLSILGIELVSCLGTLAGSGKQPLHAKGIGMYLFTNI